MSTLTKLVLGAMGALHPRPPVGDATATIELPPPDRSGGASLLDAPLDLVYVADHGRMKMVPVSQREAFSNAAAGAIAQNVNLFAASAGLATVLRAWVDREAIARSLGLSHDQQVLLSQTVGFAKA